MIRRDLPHCEEGIISAKFTLSTQQSTTYVMMMIKKSWNEHENANQIDKGKKSTEKKIKYVYRQSYHDRFWRGDFLGDFPLRLLE